MTFEIVRCTEDDLAEVCAIDRDSFTVPWSDGSFAAALMLPYYNFLIAREDGRCIGFAVGYTVAPECDLASFAVKSEYRRRGVGGALLDAFLSDAKEIGASACYLDVRESNLAAIRLYESRGFRRVDVRRNYYQKPTENAIIMMAEI